MTYNKEIHIGLLLSPKKLKNGLCLEWAEQISKMCKVTILDPSLRIQDQISQPLTHIFHQLPTIENFGIDCTSNIEYIKTNNITIIDSIECTSIFKSRKLIQNKIENIFSKNSFERVSIPNTIYCDSIPQIDLEHAYLSKPVVSCGKNGHEIFIVKNQQDLRTLSFPTILSQYVPHDNDNLIKVYYANGHVAAERRTSISEQFDSDDKNVKFGSFKKVDKSIDSEDLTALKSCVDVISQEMSIKFFGCDFIKGMDNKLYLVDINYFPTFSSVDNLGAILYDLVIKI